MPKQALDMAGGFRVGEKVIALVGTKAGEGTITRLYDDAALVSFPDAGYPETMVRPEGEYLVPFKAIQKLKPTC